jgi:hypothetical protein
MNAALEALNGSWAILAGWGVIFTVLHLCALVRYGKQSFAEWIGDLGFQLAVATSVICAGVFLSRAAIWYWRFTTGGNLAFLPDQAPPLIIGSAIGSIGFLLYIRVVTQPFGWSPVVVAACTVIAYLATFLL